MKEQLGKYPLNQENVQRFNRYSQMRVKSAFQLAHELLNDPKKPARLKEFHCLYCYYAEKGGIAGQAFTAYHCAHCGKEHHHSNTSTPKYCNECASTHQTCVRCGAGLEQDVSTPNKLAFAK